MSIHPLSMLLICKRLQESWSRSQMTECESLGYTLSRSPLGSFLNSHNASAYRDRINLCVLHPRELFSLFQLLRCTLNQLIDKGLFYRNTHFAQVKFLTPTCSRFCCICFFLIFAKMVWMQREKGSVELKFTTFCRNKRVTSWMQITLRDEFWRKLCIITTHDNDSYQDPSWVGGA